MSNVPSDGIQPEDVEPKVVVYVERADGESVEILNQIPTAESLQSSLGVFSFGGIVALSPSYLFDERNFTWQAQRSNTTVFILPSASRSADTNSSDQDNFNALGATFTLNVTVAGTGTLTMRLQGLDEVSGEYYDIGETAAIAAAIGTTVLMVHPALTVVTNERLSAILPRLYRIQVDSSDGSAWTYSVGAALTAF